MSIELKVPPLPESVADAVLVAWHKAEGDSVGRDENLVDLETDKVVLEVPAPASGKLSGIKIQPGTTVTAGQVLGYLEEGDVAEAKSPAQAQAKPATPETESSKPAPATEAADKEAAARMSPSVRHLIEENHLDVSSIQASGKAGRITKPDVTSALAKPDATPELVSALTPAHAATPAKPESKSKPAAHSVAKSVSTERSEQRVPMSRLRARIAERMVEAQHTAAMLTSFNEIDLTEVKHLRAQYRETFETKHGVRLGFMSFFVKAAVEALKEFPAVNASVEGNDVVYHNYFDIGVAVSTERGLMVPVVRDADQLSFAEIEQAIRDYATRARDGKIALDELQGGTFTITNGGVFGSLISTPILNMPQSAILGMHKIQDRPVVVNGEVVARPMMYIALTYDHRIIDGRDAVQFLVAIKEALEEPARLMLQL